MGICWYCYWGWAEPVTKIYNQALDRLKGDDQPLLYGPAHIVWEDENWAYAEACLADFDQNKSYFSEEELAVVKWSLQELIKIPLPLREIEPDNYDGKNPINYPPEKGINVIKAKGN